MKKRRSSNTGASYNRGIVKAFILVDKLHWMTLVMEMLMLLFQWSWWMPDVGTEEGEDPSWESSATTQIEVMSVFTHTHTLPIDTVLRVSSTTTYLSVKSQFLGVS